MLPAGRPGPPGALDSAGPSRLGGQGAHPAPGQARRVLGAPALLPPPAGPGPGLDPAARPAVGSPPLSFFSSLVRRIYLKPGEGKISLNKAWAVKNKYIKAIPEPWRRRSDVSKDRTDPRASQPFGKHAAAHPLRRKRSSNSGGVGLSSEEHLHGLG